MNLTIMLILLFQLIINSNTFPVTPWKTQNLGYDTSANTYKQAVVHTSGSDVNVYVVVLSNSAQSCTAFGVNATASVPQIFAQQTYNYGWTIIDGPYLSSMKKSIVLAI